MTIQTICDRCGMEYTWAGVSIGNNVYCCTGCANGGPCICPVGAVPDTPVVVNPTVTTGGRTAVVGSPAVIAGDDVIIVE